MSFLSLASLAQDGTIIMHSVRRGQYLRTLRPPCESCLSTSVAHLEVGMEGHIVAQTVIEGRSAGKVLVDIVCQNKQVFLTYCENGN